MKLSSVLTGCISALESWTNSDIDCS